MRVFPAVVLALVLAAAAFGQAAPADLPSTPSPPDSAGDLLDLDLEQLAQTPVVVPAMDVAVTSVSKEAGTVGRSAAAVFVITNEMIRRNGATSIPEALRMVPGLDVARFDSNTWSISSRGFNDIVANKLLVLVDGRTVYSPVFSGVHWDVQDYVLEDIDRIEVIRGPGGTLWGANAVNGVINIITKSAQDSQGVYANARAGTEERSTEEVRVGGQLAEDCYYRVYGKYFDRSPYNNPVQPANDGWTQGRVGFRVDWQIDEANDLTVQGDHYVGTSGVNGFHTGLTPPYITPQMGTVRNTGENVLVRFHHVVDDDSDWSMQTYFDNFERDSSILNSERARTFDLEMQYRFPFTAYQQITCGAGYRYIQDDCSSVDPFTAANLPTERNIYVANQFIQDEIQLAPDVWTLILGCKLEQNAYTHFEYQPTARLMWTPDRRHTLWGAVSRAVRTPARIERDLFFTGPPVFDTVFLRVAGDDHFQSEVMMAYELGYRTQATDDVSCEVAAFYNSYDNVRGQTAYAPEMEFSPAPPHLILPNIFANSKGVSSCGVELNASWSVTDFWRLSAYYTFLHMNEYGQTASTQASIAGQSPKNQVLVRSAWDLTENLDLDLSARYVDALRGLSVPNYITMDLRLAWRPRRHVELALVGQNLLQPHHYEFGPSPQALGREVTEVPRGVFGTLTWRR